MRYGVIGSGVVVLAGALALAAGGDGELADARRLEQAFQTAIVRAEPAVACLLVYRNDPVKPADGSPRSPDPHDRRSPPDYYGSGVVIDPQGLILTNYHVVREARGDRVYVRLPGRPDADGGDSPPREGWATIHAADNRSDLAVLKMQPSPRPYPTIPLGRGEAVRKGSLVLALGHPYAAGFRDGSPSASWGIVANLRRRQSGPPEEIEHTKSFHQYGTLIQTDAKLQLGSSGGALIDLDGKLVGLTTAQAALTGVDMPGGFAIPIDANFRRVVEVLLRGEEVEYGFLGVAAEQDSDTPHAGVALGTVTPNSPAWRAGLQRGDVILQVNGQPIREQDDLFLHLGTSLAGRRAELLVRRSGERGPRRVDVVLAKAKIPDSGFGKASVRPPAVYGLRVDYTSVVLQGPERMPDGVVVREVAANSPAKARLTENADIITEVNDRHVTTPAEFYREAEKAARSGDPIKLTLANPPRTVTLP